MNGDILEVRSIVKAEGEAEERVGGVVTSLAMSLILDMIRNMITDAILNVLGITTTTTPEPCGLGSGLIGIQSDQTAPLTYADFLYRVGTSESL